VGHGSEGKEGWGTAGQGRARQERQGTAGRGKEGRGRIGGVWLRTARSGKAKKNGWVYNLNLTHSKSRAILLWEASCHS